jgi:LmbE family N-acetylglucosaminyl deacetylase
MLSPASRILVLAPHPDDEVVGFSALIGRARAEGARVFTLMLTDGVPAAELLWPWQRRGRPGRVARRQAEAQAAAALLDAEPVGFLDIPTRRLKDEYGAARHAVSEALTSLRPEALWVPAYEGGHQDHDVASLLASTFRRDVPVFEAPLYNFAHGRVNSQCFIAPHPDTLDILLTPDETAAKRRQLAAYASEQGNLDYIKVGREGLRPQPVHDYSRPPHPGPAFYQRFQWVPFRHPRIDFTTPEELCRVMTGLAGP